MELIKYEKKLKVPIPRKDVYYALEYQPSKTIQEIYKDGKIENEKGEIKKLTSAIGPLEGYHLYSLVYKNDLKQVLEVGMANGISGLFVCQALSDLAKDTGNKSRKLTSIDPFQSSQWENAGITSIKKAKLKTYHTLIEEKSFIAMPNLVQAKKKYDMVFIDGMHLFDYTLIDLFYADQLLNIGGIIALDDIRHPGTGKAYEYILTNYKHWKLIPYTLASDTMATFVKIREDTREWYFHNRF
jgi:predicted O-methyltransferase YrrM